MFSIQMKARQHEKVKVERIKQINMLDMLKANKLLF